LAVAEPPHVGFTPLLPFAVAKGGPGSHNTCLLAPFLFDYIGARESRDGSISLPF